MTEDRLIFCFSDLFHKLSGSSVKSLSEPAIIYINFVHFSDYEHGFW